MFFTGKHLCQSFFFNKVAALRATFIKKETLAQVFSCEFCEISKNTFSYRTHPVAASEGRPAKCKCQDLIHLTPYIKQDQIIEESTGFIYEQWNKAYFCVSPDLFVMAVFYEK